MPLYTIPSFTGTTTQGTPTQQQINGCRFTVEETVDVDILSFFRRQTSGQAKPTNLTLWQMSSASAGSVLAVVSTVVDDGNLGWQDSSLGTPVTLSPGITYQITGCHDPGVYGVITNSQRDPADYPFVIPDTTGRYRLNTCANPPDTDGTNAFVTVRVGSSGASAPDPGEAPTNLSIENAFARWLHGDDAPSLRPDSLPVLIKGVVDGLATAVGDIGTAVTTLGGNVTTLMTRTAGMVGGTMQNALDDLGTALTGTVNAFSTTFDAFNTTWDDFSTGFSQLVGGTHNRSIVDTTAVGDPTFTETDSDTGAGAFIFNVPADFYILTITNPEALRQGIVIGGVPYFKHRGAWCSLDDGVCGDHHTIVGTTHVLRERGSKLQGILVYLDPDIEWTIQAFSYVPPSP